MSGVRLPKQIVFGLRVQCGEDGLGRRNSGPIAYKARHPGV